MSHSINIPTFVTERKQDIIELSRFKRKANQNGGSTRERIAMYRTRSYRRYGMSHAVRQRNKRGPFLVNKGSKENKVLYRRHKRFPRVLQSTFFRNGQTAKVPSRTSQPATKKHRVSEAPHAKKESIHTDADSAQAGLPGRLNTHIWHVKRFFVERQHNWYIPTKHKSRGLKAVDGLADKCVVQDVSYLMGHQLPKDHKVTGFHTMQITGSAADINSLFSHFCDPLEVVVDEPDADTHTSTAPAVEKEVTFFARGKFPAACIGPVTLIVLPVVATVSELVATPRDQAYKVVMSCHPAVAHAVHQQLHSALHGKPSLMKQADHADDDEMSVDSQDSSSAQDHAPLSSNCKLHLAPAQWNRIRLRGKDAVKTLLTLLHPPSDPCRDSTASATTTSHGTDEEARNIAKIEYLRTILSVRNVSNLWADGNVVAVNVRDPRLNPQKAETDPAAAVTINVADAVDRKEQQRKVSAQLAHRPVDLASSPLFQDHSTFQLKSEHEVNTEKHAAKISQWEGLFQTTTPFAPLSPPPAAVSGNAPSTTTTQHAKQGSSAHCVVPDHMCPLWIVRKQSVARSHKTHKHSMEGFDITLPAAWGSLLFQTLQLRGGAAAVGSEEVDHLCAKAGVPSFPRDYPDTHVGRAYWQAHHDTLCAENVKRPPAKQVAHNCLATLLRSAANIAATGTEGKIASSDTTEPASITSEYLSSVLIVRGENYLRDFRPPAYEDLSKATIEKTRQEIATQQRADSTYTWDSPYIPRLPSLPSLMFLQVLLVPVSKGLVLDLAEIICPTEADIELFCAHKLNTQVRRKGPQDSTEDSLLSVAHSGFYKQSAAQKAAEAARVNKKQEVQELPQSWLGVQLTQKVKHVAASASKCESSGAEQVPVVSRAEQDLGTKEKKHKLKGSKFVPLCADYDIGMQEGRKIIGTVTTGQKEHLNNTHFAIGLCNVNALNELFRRSYGRYLHSQAHILVLFRNARSDWLRPAVLQIV